MDQHDPCTAVAGIVEAASHASPDSFHLVSPHEHESIVNRRITHANVRAASAALLDYGRANRRHVSGSDSTRNTLATRRS